MPVSYLVLIVLRNDVNELDVEQLAEDGGLGPADVHLSGGHLGPAGDWCGVRCFGRATLVTGWTVWKQME